MTKPSTLTTLDLQSFDPTIKNAKKPVVVMFYTTTCPNCAAIDPVYRDLAAEMGEQATFAKLNAQQNSVIAARYGIMGVPTFKIFCGGRPISELVGAINATMLRNTVKDVIRHRRECVSRSSPINWEMDGYA